MFIIQNSCASIDTLFELHVENNNMEVNLWVINLYMGGICIRRILFGVDIDLVIQDWDNCVSSEATCYFMLTQIQYSCRNILLCPTQSHVPCLPSSPIFNRLNEDLSNGL